MEHPDPADRIVPSPPAAEEPLNVPLGQLVRRAPVTCGEAVPLREALALMRAAKVGSVLVTDALGAPAGMFTLHDLRDRVALGGWDLDQAMAAVMTPQPFCLPAAAPAFEAALAMARLGIHHIVVTAGDAVSGVISERDLFSLQRVGVARLASDIRAAGGLDPLVAAARDIRELARGLLAQGVGADYLTRILSQLNDQLTIRLIELECGRARVDARGFCWLALGSEGRFEQTLLTDQDNGLIFVVPEGETAQAVRARLLPVARRINEGLDACGFPLCKGGVMASNPQWCLSLEEWQATFAEWIHRGDAPVLLSASIFFDFRALYGRADLAQALRDGLHERIRDNRHFLRLMTINALGHRPPLGLMRDFVVEADAEPPNTLDLKLNGITPFVDAARIFALAAGLADSGTVTRLRGAAAAWQLDAAEAEGWIEAFQFIQRLRLQRQQERLARGEPPSNRLDPEALSALDRRILKEAFRQARRLQATLERYFQF